jgi:hypothetical protein
MRGKIILIWLLASAVLILLVMRLAPPAHADDCQMLASRQVSARNDGYHIYFPTGREIGSLKFEIVPHAEAQLSPDGAFWRCGRPDGSRRCFFAPVPST